MISFREGVTKDGVEGPVFYAMGVTEMIFYSEGLPLLVTKLKPLSIDFSVELIYRGVIASIMKNMYRVLELMGFHIALRGNTIHCTYDPRKGML